MAIQFKDGKTVLHKDAQLSMEGLVSESHCCVDCGVNTSPGAPPRELAEFLLNRDGEVPMRHTWDSEMYMVFC